MTATEKKIDEMVKGIEKMELEALIVLVHESYFFEYWQQADISLVNGMDKDTGAIYWEIADIENDITYRGSSVRECYEIMYQAILEHCYREQLKKERDQEAEQAYLEEMETHESFDKWYNSNNGVPYGRY